LKAYEAVYIFDSSLSEDQAVDLKEKVSAIITREKGTLHEIRYWGKRRFAYPIDKKRDGHYFLFIFDAEETVPLELNHFTRITEPVLRSMIIKRTVRKDRRRKKQDIPVKAPVIPVSAPVVTEPVDLSVPVEIETETTPEVAENVE
jgi:small subunit ribosomal protein S6